MARSGWQEGKLESRRFSDPLKPDLELLHPMVIILLIPITFMGISTGGRMNASRDHGAEKSDYFAFDRQELGALSQAVERRGDLLHDQGQVSGSCA